MASRKEIDRIIESLRGGQSTLPQASLDSNTGGQRQVAPFLSSPTSVSPLDVTTKRIQDTSREIGNTTQRLEAAGEDVSGIMDTRNPIEKMLNLTENQNVIFDIFEMLQRPQKAIFGAIQEATDMTKAESNKDIGGAFMAGLTGENKEIFGGQILRNVFQEGKEETGDFDWTDIAGFAMEAVLDPVELIKIKATGGLSFLAKVPKGINSSYKLLEEMTPAIQSLAKGAGDPDMAKQILKLGTEHLNEATKVAQAAERLNPNQIVFRLLGKGIKGTTGVAKNTFEHMLSAIAPDTFVKYSSLKAQAAIKLSTQGRVIQRIMSYSSAKADEFEKLSRSMKDNFVAQVDNLAKNKLQDDVIDALLTDFDLNLRPESMQKLSGKFLDNNLFKEDRLKTSIMEEIRALKPTAALDDVKQIIRNAEKVRISEQIMNLYEYTEFARDTYSWNDFVEMIIHRNDKTIGHTPEAEKILKQVLGVDYDKMVKRSTSVNGIEVLTFNKEFFNKQNAQSLMRYVNTSSGTPNEVSEIFNDTFKRLKEGSNGDKEIARKSGMPMPKQAAEKSMLLGFVEDAKKSTNSLNFWKNKKDKLSMLFSVDEMAILEEALNKDVVGGSSVYGQFVSALGEFYPPFKEVKEQFVKSLQPEAQKNARDLLEQALKPKDDVITKATKKVSKKAKAVVTPEVPIEEVPIPPSQKYKAGVVRNKIKEYGENYEIDSKVMSRHMGYPEQVVIKTDVLKGIEQSVQDEFGTLLTSGKKLTKAQKTKVAKFVDEQIKKAGRDFYDLDTLSRSHPDQLVAIKNAILDGDGLLKNVSSLDTLNIPVNYNREALMQELQDIIKAYDSGDLIKLDHKTPENIAMLMEIFPEKQDELMQMVRELDTEADMFGGILKEVEDHRMVYDMVERGVVPPVNTNVLDSVPTKPVVEEVVAKVEPKPTAVTDAPTKPFNKIAVGENDPLGQKLADFSEKNNIPIKQDLFDSLQPLEKKRLHNLLIDGVNASKKKVIDDPISEVFSDHDNAELIVSSLLDTDLKMLGGNFRVAQDSYKELVRLREGLNAILDMDYSEFTTEAGTLVRRGGKTNLLSMLDNLDKEQRHFDSIINMVNREIETKNLSDGLEKIIEEINSESRISRLPEFQDELRKTDPSVKSLGERVQEQEAKLVAKKLAEEEAVKLGKEAPKTDIEERIPKKKAEPKPKAEPKAEKTKKGVEPAKADDAVKVEVVEPTVEVVEPTVEVFEPKVEMEKPVGEPVQPFTKKIVRTSTYEYGDEFARKVTAGTSGVKMSGRQSDNLLRGFDLNLPNGNIMKLTSMFSDEDQILLKNATNDGQENLLETLQDLLNKPEYSELWGFIKDTDLQVYSTLKAESVVDILTGEIIKPVSDYLGAKLPIGTMYTKEQIALFEELAKDEELMGAVGGFKTALTDVQKLMAKFELGDENRLIERGMKSGYAPHVYKQDRMREAVRMATDKGIDIETGKPLTEEAMLRYKRISEGVKDIAADKGLPSDLFAPYNRATWSTRKYPMTALEVQNLRNMYYQESVIKSEWFQTEIPDEIKDDVINYFKNDLFSLDARASLDTLITTKYKALHKNRRNTDILAAMAFGGRQDGADFMVIKDLDSATPQGYTKLDTKDIQKIYNGLSDMVRWTGKDGYSAKLVDKLKTTVGDGRTKDMFLENHIYNIMVETFNKKDAELLDVVDGINNFFKAGKVLSPSFNIRNFGGNMFNMWVSGVPFKEIPGYWGEAISMVQHFREIDAKVAAGGLANLSGAEKHIYDTVMDFKRNGFFTSQNIMELNDLTKLKEFTMKNGKIPEMIRKSPLNKLSELNLKGNLFIDNVSRIALYNYALKNPDYLHKLGLQNSAAGAMDAVRLALFDPNDLTFFEQDVMKKLIPFYTWARQNLTFQIENLMTNTEKYYRTYKGIKASWEALDIDYEELPDYEREQLTVPIPFLTKNGSYTSLKMNLPMADLLDFSTPSGALKKVMSATTPLIRAPFEAASNTSIFTGRPISEYEGQLSRTIIGMDRKTEWALGNFGMDTPLKMLSSLAGVGIEATGGEVKQLQDPLSQFIGIISPERQVAQNTLSKNYERIEGLNARLRKVKDSGKNLPTLAEINGTQATKSYSQNTDRLNVVMDKLRKKIR